MPAGNKPSSSDPSAARTEAAQTGTAKPRLAILSWPAIIAFLAITATGLTLDLWSKNHVFTKLLEQPGLAEKVQRTQGTVEPQRMLPYLNLHEQVGWNMKYTLSTNPGVVFGLGMPPLLVALVSIFTIALVFFFFASNNVRAWIMHVALACILSGALGNLYDRLFSAVYIPGLDKPIQHQVRDFIDLGDIHFLPFKIAGYDNYPWVFNVADVLLVAGVALLMLNWIVHRKDGKQR